MIKIKVVPNSSKQEIKKINYAEYKVNLKSAAEKNKANIELIKLLKDYFKRDVRILKGVKGRNKLIDLRCQ